MNSTDIYIFPSRSRFKITGGQFFCCSGAEVELSGFFVTFCWNHPIRSTTSSKTKKNPSWKWHCQSSASEIATWATAAPGCRIIDVITAAALSSSPMIKFLSLSASLSLWSVGTENCSSLRQDVKNWKLIFVHSVTGSFGSAVQGFIVKSGANFSR